jgi:type II secretory ATPase GspE/PulE/Tfp pilus assembly ATPase PilB-like protein
VEITQPGLRQVQINPRIDWTFEKALRSFLRADPDVIMVGEVRDRETARVAVEAALTGHLVLSTIHTNSAPETITRLLDMGMDPFNFGDSLLAVLGQRLVRRLCTACRHSRPASRQELDELLADYLHAGHRGRGTQEAQLLADWTSRLAQQGTLKTWHAHGCSHCDGTGLRGRVGLHELLMVTREIRRLIHTRQPISQIQACALEQGMLTLRQDGIEKVLQGLTTLAEVRATVND